MARAATSPELALFRTAGQWSKLRAAILAPTTVYTARINQTFSTTDSVLEITYDTGSGTLSDVLADQTMLVGSTAGGHDIGICRVRAIDGTKVYINETSDIPWDDNLYLTILRDWSLWAKHVLISSGTPFMDGGIAYSDQHSVFDPTPIMGSHRVLKLTGASISTTFDWSDSYVIDGSAIDTYATSAPSAASSSGMTTTTPTVTFDATGWHPIYLTLTAANGKTFFAIRWVYIWSDDDPPPSCVIGDCRGEAETGGWQFRLTLFDNVSVETVRDRALVILFAEDHYGSTEQSIGPLEGCENVIATGWIGGEESINWNPQQGQVELTAYTAQYWFGRIPSFPDGVEFKTSTPAAWTEMQNLTVDLGLWHFLHWRTTAMRVMDVFLSGDTRYTKEVSSVGGNLWEQMREMAFLQIFARPGVDRYNRLFIEIYPQLVPGTRTHPNVMVITKPDWEGEIAFDRITVQPNALVNLSGVAVNSSGVGTPYFALAPGHAYAHYGSLELLDRILVESQDQANDLCGLYRSWLNNQFPDIPITLSANNRLIDCFPRQQCSISIAAGDTPRGIAYTGGLIPKSIAFVQDPETGHLHTEVSFEAETVEGLVINGDIPGSRADVSVPPLPKFPPLPDFPVILPGTSSQNPVTTSLLLHDAGKGFIYTVDFDASSPHWLTMNSGLTLAQYQNANFMFLCPNGSVYCGLINNDSLTNSFIARAPALGGTWTIVEDATSALAKYSSDPNTRIFSCNLNSLVAEQVCYIMGIRGTSVDAWIGSNGTYSQGASLSTLSSGYISYGFGKWRVAGKKIIGFSLLPHYWLLDSAASSVSSEAASPGDFEGVHYSAGTTPIIFAERTGFLGLYKFINNFLDTPTYITDDLDAGQGMASDYAGTNLMAEWDIGERGKSSDGGTTWASMGSLPFAHDYIFCFLGGNAWVAAVSVVRYSPDFGTTWYNREGDISSIAPILAVNMVSAIPTAV